MTTGRINQVSTVQTFSPSLIKNRGGAKVPEIHLKQSRSGGLKAKLGRFLFFASTGDTKATYFHEMVSFQSGQGKQAGPTKFPFQVPQSVVRKSENACLGKHRMLTTKQESLHVHFRRGLIEFGHT